MAALKTHHIAAYVLAGILALVLGLWAGGLRENGDGEPRGIALQGGTAMGHLHRSIPEFTLADAAGRPFTRERLLGRWSFMFFGYTHCPDICPMTMAILANTAKAIDENAADGSAAPYQVIFVSVDPERDEPEQLNAYVSYFNPDFVGVTGDRSAIESLTSELGILHVRVPDPNNAGNYLVDHSASILLVNPAGELEAILSAPHSAEVMASDFRTLLQQYDRG